jgi:hypothetical protein
VVPVSKLQEGFPIAVQIVGRPWEDEKVLTVASALERECAAWRTPALLTDLHHELANMFVLFRRCFTPGNLVNTRFQSLWADSTP